MWFNKHFNVTPDELRVLGFFKTLNAANKTILKLINDSDYVPWDFIKSWS